MTARFEKESRLWADQSIFYFRLGGVSRSCSLIDLGRRLGIYTAEETLCPHFYAFLDSCITAPLWEYDSMQVWAHAWGTNVSRVAKESSGGPISHARIHHFSLTEV